MRWVSRHGQASDVGRPRRRGFTIIELLVTVAALAVMLVAFGRILSECKAVVHGSERMMRTLHRVSSVSSMIRSDLQRMSRDGFLAITMGSIQDAHPGLIFTTAGPTRSIIGSVEGRGSIVAYSLAEHLDADRGREILWRPEWVFFYSGSYAAGSPPDVAAFMFSGAGGKYDQLESYKVAARGTVEGVAEHIIGTENAGAGFRLPPRTKSEADALWSAVIQDMEFFSVMWTDCELDSDTNGFAWYGWEALPHTDDDGDGVPDTYIYQSTAKGSGGAEYGGGGGYAALWTGRNPNNWPKAIKVTYKINDEDLPPGLTGVYEVLCEIP